MRNIITLLKKEMLSFFFSPIAYIVMVVFLIMSGTVFWLIFSAMSDPSWQGAGAVMEFFFAGVLLWFYVLPLCPALTMRSFAEERRSGTIEVLLTAPITDFQTVVAKYLAAWFFYVLLWVPTLLYILILRYFTEIDLGPVFSGYVGELLIGGLFISIGLLTSSLSKNQIVAYITALVASVSIFLLGIFEYVVANPKLKEVISQINMFEHLQSFARGVLDTRHVVYYLSLTIFVLFLTVRAVESRKWR